MREKRSQQPMLIHHLEQRIPAVLGVETTVNQIRNDAQTIVLANKRNPPHLL
jgi:hypothetical protein